MNWTFGQKLALSTAVAVLAVATIGIAGYRATTQLIENSVLVNRSQEAKLTLEELIAALSSLETGQRGFLLTADDRFLEPYHEALGEVDRHLSRARELVSGEGVPQQRMAELGPLVDTRLGIMTKAMDLRRQQGLDAVAKSDVLNQGREQMAQIRRIVAELGQNEGRLLAERRKQSEEAASATKTVILWGSLLGSLLVFAAGAVISRSLTSQIGVAVRHIQSSAAELQAAASQQASGAKEQSTAMNEITTTISELLTTSRQIAESSRRVADIATQTASQTRTGDSTVARGSDAVTGIKRQVDAIVTNMLELGKKSQQIGAVLDIVSELAEQTNILAINATIEAAGAGETGRRFGVVADEIRKLADRVGGSTKEIRDLIEDVRSAVNTTVMTTEAGSKAVEAGSDEFGQVAGSFRLISGQVETTTQAAKEIELSTKQQASAVEQVNIAITNVAQASKETEVSTGQTLRTASELAALSRDLLRLVEAERVRPVARAHES